MAVIDEVVLHDLHMPLAEPYPSAIATIVALETLLVEVRTRDGRHGFGEAAIVEGYTHETREGGWNFCREHAARILGRDTADAKRELLAHRDEHSHAVASLVSAMEMAEGHPLLAPPGSEVRVPLLAPVNAKKAPAIALEIERLLAAGFRTLKVKVGFDVPADLERVAAIQRVVGDRAKLRLDGNQGYSQAQALQFTSGLSSVGIELFEQPCGDRDWDAAAAVAKVAPVPMMLDESIYASSDIDRAAVLKAAAFIKLKLVKAGGIDALVSDLERVTAHGMRRVLGNGVAGETGCWMEACVAHKYIDNAGELNGYLKPVERLFENPLGFADGCVVMPAGYAPCIDRQALARFAIRSECYSKTRGMQ